GYYFAVAEDFPRDILPGEHGLIVADEHDAAILREAPHRPMPAARRRAQILRFGLTAAMRLSHATGFVRPDQDWRED
ncbi:MAG: MmcB family DNA repair protein, partial [Rhodospirillaceae bacterium]|nr:MmcB family DNA repair protein [Rhodospirillaceae bacterium]